MAFSPSEKGVCLETNKRCFTLFFFYFLPKYWVKMEKTRTNSGERRKPGGKLLRELKIALYRSD